jgi:hypothetical protein
VKRFWLKIKLNRRTLWRWLCLGLLIPILPARALYYLNKIASKYHGNRPKESNAYAESIFNQILHSNAALQTSQHAVPLRKPRFLDNGFLHSSAGIAAFKKEPDSPVLDQYLACQLEGMAYFDSVFRRIEEHHASHMEIMVAHHRILASGLDNRQSYQVGFSNESSKDVAGKIRHTEGRIAFPVRGSKAVKAIVHALTEIERYHYGRWVIQIDGIPKQAWSCAKRIKQGFDIVHPDGKYIPMYFSKMEECLDVLRYLTCECMPSGDRRRDLLLRALATYFHLGIHAHAFVRINQSLLWSQVNYILMLNGYQPVHHGYVDLVAAFLDIWHFCDYFKRYVSKHSSLNKIALHS